MNYILFYKKNDSEIEASCLYSISLQQVLNFYYNFGKDLKFLYLTLFNNYQDNQVILIDCNKILFPDLTVENLNTLLRNKYNLDNNYFLS